MATFKYDLGAKGLYIKLLDLPISKTEELVRDEVFIDITELGQIAGIEVLNVEAE